MGRDSSGGVATRYWLNGQGVESRWGWNLPHLSIPALRSTHPPIQRASGLSRG